MHRPNPHFYPYSAGITPKLEWLVVGAFIFLSILAWVEILRTIFVRSFGGHSEIHLWTQFLFALTLSSITLVLIFFLRKQLGLVDVPTMSHLEVE